MLRHIKHIIAASLFLIIAFAGYKIVWRHFPSFSSTSTQPGCGTVTEPVAEHASATAILGKALFQQNCASCHALFKDATGPGLFGFTGREPWTNRENVYAWIRNPEAFMKRNKYLLELKKMYGSVMTAFPQMTDAEIDAICDYISFQENRKSMPVAAR